MDKKYIIVLNGNMPKKINKDFFENSKIVCADGAYRHMLKLGIKPDILIGDFDSINTDLPTDIEILKFNSDKDSTDGQLALEYAIKNKAKSVVFLGVSGGREDHFFGNISLLFLAHKKGLKAEIFTDECKIYVIDGKFEMACTKNKYFSIVPFSNELHIMNTEGLKYKVVNKSLYMHETLGISNCTTEEKVVIETAYGVGLAFMTFEDVK